MAMDKLYNIFERESKNIKNNFSDMDITLHYNKLRNSMDYSNGNGTLTVVFNPDGKEGCEDFYFKGDKYDTGLGTLVLQTMDEGKFGVSPDYIISKIPKEFIEIAQRYQFDRNEIGVEKKAEKPKGKNNIERD